MLIIKQKAEFGFFLFNLSSISKQIISRRKNRIRFTRQSTPQISLQKILIELFLKSPSFSSLSLFFKFLFFVQSSSQIKFNPTHSVLKLIRNRIHSILISFKQINLKVFIHFSSPNHPSTRSSLMFSIP